MITGDSPSLIVRSRAERRGQNEWHCVDSIGLLRIQKILANARSSLQRLLVETSITVSIRVGQHCLLADEGLAQRDLISPITFGNGYHELEISESREDRVDYCLSDMVDCSIV